MTLPREDVRRASGRAVLCGFEGTQVSAELREILRETQALGVILFARNVEEPAQVAELCAEIKSLRPDDPLLVCVDQEGGRVARIRAPATEWPAMRQLGSLADEQLTERVARALGVELRAMNIDIDFAPVLDVDTNPDNPVIGDRSLSEDPTTAGRLGAAIVRGLHDAGVGACGKHFPGHGDTDVDSHKALPRVRHDLERLRAVEWPPFRMAIEAGLGAVMSAHVVVEALDDEHPATLSPAGLAPLRAELGFEGVICSDDLEMKAVAAHYSVDEIATRGLAAGIDIFLACRDPEVVLGTYRAVVQAAERRELKHDDLRALERRALAWRDRFVQPAGPPQRLAEVVGCGEHRALVDEIAERRAQRV